MYSAITGFILGIAGLQQQAALPGKTVLLILSSLAVAFLVLSFVPVLKQRFEPAVMLARALAGCCAGIVWASALAYVTLSENLPPSLENRPITVTGTIADLPQATENGIRFPFHVERAFCENKPVTIPENILLHWRNTPGTAGGENTHRLMPGQKWRFDVRLKRPHGHANPGGFDYEYQLFAKKIRAIGHIDNKQATHNTLIEPFVWSPMHVIDALRFHIRERIAGALQGDAYAGVIIALVIGDQNAISRADWKLFSQTGISHLVAISGLHITLVAGLFAVLTGALWRRSFFTNIPLPLMLPAQKAAAIAGLVMALIYVALAGFGVPARRTLCMLAIVAAALWSGRQIRISRVLLAAAGLVLLTDPPAVMKPGFWLSFGAVGIILYTTVGRVHPVTQNTSRLRKWLHGLIAAARTQWAVTAGLVPLTMLFFGHISLIGPAANAIAIPVVTLLVTPLSLIGSILPEPLCTYILKTAHLAFEWLAVFLDWLASFSFAVWHAPSPPLYLIAFAIAGTLWMLAPKGWPLRALGILCWLPLFLGAPEHPEKGEMHVTVLDVGQGGAVLVETQHHRLLFDTGPSYSYASDAAGHIILPYLQTRGIRELDTIVVSHGDDDHAGGLLAITRVMPAKDILTSMSPDKLLVKVLPTHRPCLAGQHWEWDGIRFDVLYPSSDDYLEKSSKTNSLSCVLKVSNEYRSVLLTGDIEGREERELVARYGETLHADILAVPHHGSATSSTWPFLLAVSPEIAIFQTGYLNRYGHPNPRITERYDIMKTYLYRSDRDGAILMKIGPGIETVTQRSENARYWHTP